MNHQKYPHRRSLPIAMLALAIGATLPVTANAGSGDQSFDVTFNANIRNTTCDMTINGANAAATITIGTGQVTLSDIIHHKDDNTTTAPNMATFSLEVKNCPTSFSGIKTTISGTPYANDATILLPGTSDSRNATSALGVKISRASASTDYFKIFSGTNTSESGSEVIIWTADEMDKAKDGKVMLLARLVPTGEYSKTNPGIGQFQATATFNFSYE